LTTFAAGGPSRGSPAPSQALLGVPTAAEHQDLDAAHVTRAGARATGRDIVEGHGLALGERAVQHCQPLARGTSALARYLEERCADHLELVDISTLALMEIDALAS